MIVFVVAFVIAVMIFSGVFGGGKGSTSTGPSGNVLIWGVLPDETMQQFTTDFNVKNVGYTISYQEHKPENFNQDLIVALANNTPPSLVIFSSEIFSAFRDKLYTIPYEAYPQRTFFDTNVEGAKVFLTKDGVIAAPLVLDPIVVYYNKDLLYGANIITPPTTWGDMQKTVRLLTKKDARNNILQSTINLGTSQNINNLREIISAMFLQTGNPIISYDIATDTKKVTIAGDDDSIALVGDALDFFTSFSNPTNINYSWNSSFSSSLDMFLSGKLAFYVGKASELFDIRAKNPNLNFDVMELFKTNGATRSYTYGSFAGIGMLKVAPNPVAAYAALNYISSKESVDILSKSLSLPPSRRDLLLFQQKDPYIDVFFKSALSAFSWPDSNPLGTEEFFRGMIRDVTSGKSDSAAAVYELSKNLQSYTR
jgi:ABC-type glycerol-3-phosphate transport system substrate-binding protein